MSIEVACPGCGRTYQVPESRAGQSANCKHCREVIDVPLPADGGGLDDLFERGDAANWHRRAPAKDPQLEDEEPEPAPSPRRSVGGLGAALGIAGGLGLVLLLVMVIGIVGRMFGVTRSVPREASIRFPDQPNPPPLPQLDPSEQLRDLKAKANAQLAEMRKDMEIRQPSDPSERLRAMRERANARLAQMRQDMESRRPNGAGFGPPPGFPAIGPPDQGQGQGQGQPVFEGRLNASPARRLLDTLDLPSTSAADSAQLLAQLAAIPPTDDLRDDVMTKAQAIVQAGSTHAATIRNAYSVIANWASPDHAEVLGRAIAAPGVPTLARRDLIAALGRVGDAEDLPALREIAATDRSGQVKKAADEAIKAIESKSGPN